MAFDEEVAARIRAARAITGPLEEKKMFGGLCFLHEGKMCCGVLGEDLVLRLDPDAAEVLLKERHVRPMDFTGRPMRGYLYIGPEAIKREADLHRYLAQAVDFVRQLPSKRPGKARSK